MMKNFQKDSQLAAEKSGRDYSPSLLITVPAPLGGLRLDVALAKLFPEHSRSRLQGWIRAARVLINDAPCLDPKKKLIGGEQLALSPEASFEETAFSPEAILFPIVYEDETVLVVNKPAGLVVHPGNGHHSGTLLNALLHHCPSLQHLPRAGIVHRLDKDTTGLMVVAKTLTAQTHLVRQLQDRSVKRHYRALVRGLLFDDGFVDAPIGRHPKERTKMAIVRGNHGKPAKTHYRVLERFIESTFIACALETGRTHQIRVHLEFLGHPLVGDPIYGTKNNRVPKVADFPRQALHAQQLEFIHPQTHLPIRFTAPLPDDMKSLIAKERAMKEEQKETSYSEEDWDDFPEEASFIDACAEETKEDADFDEDLAINYPPLPSLSTEQRRFDTQNK